MRPRGAHLALLAACLAVFLWSVIRPHDYLTWALETFPVMLGVPLLIGLYQAGKLKLDELITRTYSLDQINEGYQDMRDGRNIRGVIRY